MLRVVGHTGPTGASFRRTDPNGLHPGRNNVPLTHQRRIFHTSIAAAFVEIDSNCICHVRGSLAFAHAAICCHVCVPLLWDGSRYPLSICVSRGEGGDGLLPLDIAPERASGWPTLVALHFLLPSSSVFWCRHET